jgi:hypothetical protein
MLSSRTNRFKRFKRCVWFEASSEPKKASNNDMGRSAWGARGCAAVVLMAGCLAVTASAQQASAPPASAGSTFSATANQNPPSTSGITQQPPVAGRADDGRTPRSELPISVDRIRDGLAREPVLRLDVQPVYRVEIRERRPRYWDLEADFTFPEEPRTSTTRWHDEFLAMVTPPEARLYSPMLTGSEIATISATSLAFAGAAELVKSGFKEWRTSRKNARERAARKEVDAAMLEWEFANPPARPSQ